MMKKIEQTAVGHFKYLPEKLGFTTSQYQGLHIINCGLGSSMFNIVFGSLQSEPETWPNEIQNVIHQFREQPFTWWILPSQYLPDFSCCLKEEGFIQETREHAMLCNLEFFEPQLLQTKLVVRQVLNLNDLLDFISVLEPYDKMARCFYEKLSVDILNSKEKLFIGYQQSTPAVIGI